ncbi:hypothetical protein BLA60_25995 [Actinophytocola xinjiangensis]|uniref:Uncharacterized protein n=1 Tax=Actinophytocola xinjiangensis TaxID=485602 RepID=A0A7Z1AWB7_9PSEU|nr:hypothetical protein [Actinophytocola xinjiangensis]OLF07780.1 hypothetical protein BLA60_25995 [Actinophytocola xinjiangensis]
MRGRSLVATALPLVAVVLVFSAAPALAQPITTPVPTPTDPSSPQMSELAADRPAGRVVADAGTGLGIVRILPNSVPTRAIVPGAEDKLPKQPAVEVGFGISSAQVNSESYLEFEHAIAQAAPGGLAVQGATPQAPGALAQTAPPNNPRPTHGGLTLPRTPLDTMITGSALQGQVHAQWDDTLGPCVRTIADASTEVASLSLVNAIPTLPTVTDLTGVFDAPRLDARADQEIIAGLRRLAGPLSSLGGVLAGEGAPRADGTGSLVSLPNTLSTRSVVRLVDLPGSPNKAVQATSTLQVAAVTLLAGTPFAIELRVVGQPTLQVTATGDPRTSTVHYVAPVIEVWQGGRHIGGLDAANPTVDIPIGLPLPGGPGQLPVIGDLLANGQRATDALRRLDLGVLRLGVAQLDEKREPMTTPFPGHQLGATARMLDVQVLPTQALGLPNLPSALAQVSLGEQIARAYAPTGGVVCGTTGQPAPPPAPTPQGKQPPGLAYTTLAYKTVPMFWTGTAMLLIGVVLVAAIPATRFPRRAVAGPPTDPEPPRPDTKRPDEDPVAADPEPREVEPATATPTDDTSTPTVASPAAEPQPANSAGAESDDQGADSPEQPDTNPVDPNPTDAEPTEADPADTARADADPANTEPTDANSTDPQPTETSSADPQPTEASSAGPEPTETSSANPEPTETSSAGAEPIVELADAEPVENPADTTRVEKPTEANPAETESTSAPTSDDTGRS